MAHRPSDWSEIARQQSHSARQSSPSTGQPLLTTISRSLLTDTRKLPSPQQSVRPSSTSTGTRRVGGLRLLSTFRRSKGSLCPRRSSGSLALFGTLIRRSKTSPMRWRFTSAPSSKRRISGAMSNGTLTPFRMPSFLIRVFSARLAERRAPPTRPSAGTSKPKRWSYFLASAWSRNSTSNELHQY